MKRETNCLEHGLMSWTKGIEPTKVHVKRMQEWWPKYERMVYQHCWKRVRTFGIPFEEASSMGKIIFMQCCMKYKPKTAKFSTFLFTYLSTTLHRECKSWRQKKEQLPTLTETDCNTFHITAPLVTGGVVSRVGLRNGDGTEIGNSVLDSVVEDNHWWTNAEALSPSAKKVMELVTNPPEKLTGMLSWFTRGNTTSGAFKRALILYLQNYLDWSDEKIERTEEEIQFFLSDKWKKNHA
jgi:hypothetical protein